VDVLSADVAGYSRLMEADEEGTLAALKAIRRELGDPKIAEHRGRIAKTTGDGLLIEFRSLIYALRCAVEIQRGMAERNTALPEGKRIEFRIGVNLGDIIRDDGDILGDGVNIAARLEALAEPGGICFGASAYEQVRDKLDLVFADTGEQRSRTSRGRCGCTASGEARCRCDSLAGHPAAAETSEAITRLDITLGWPRQTVRAVRISAPSRPGCAVTRGRSLAGAAVCNAPGARSRTPGVPRDRP